MPRRQTRYYTAILQRVTFANFRSEAVDFSTYIFARPYIHCGNTITKNGGWTTRVRLIYREILRSRHRETIHSGTTVTFQTRTAIVSISRYRAGDESLFLLSIRTTTNKRTNERTDQETKFQFWRVCACSRRYTSRASRCTTYALLVYNRVHRLYTHTSR